MNFQAIQSLSFYAEAFFFLFHYFFLYLIWEFNTSFNNKNNISSRVFYMIVFSVIISNIRHNIFVNNPNDFFNTKYRYFSVSSRKMIISFKIGGMLTNIPLPFDQTLWMKKRMINSIEFICMQFDFQNIFFCT